MATAGVVAVLLTTTGTPMASTTARSTGRIHAGTLGADAHAACTSAWACRSTGCCGWPWSRLSRWSRSRWSSAAAAAARDHARHRGQGSAPPRYRRTPRAPRHTRLRPVNRRAPGRFRRPPATTAPHPLCFVPVRRAAAGALFRSCCLTVSQIGILAVLYPAVWGTDNSATGALSDRIGRESFPTAGLSPRR